jgi:hypothetical protein
MAEGIAPCDRLVRDHAIPEDIQDESWEVGRLVLAPQYRSGPESLKRCLFLTLVHLIGHTEVKNLFASCSPVLSRLYRRFGFAVLVKDATRDADGATYSLIHGTVPNVLRALAGSDAERAQAEEILAIREAMETLPC